MNGEPARTDLAAAARLLGRLLVRELDARTLSELRQPAVAGALAELGIDVPPDDALQGLAQEYFACFLHPAAGRPPVQSLFHEGHYDGDPAVAIRRIADAAGRELASGARGAPPDHLGCILLLWAELRHERPELAALLVRHHLAWADGALRPAARRSGFYGAVARATAALVRELAVSSGCGRHAR